MLSKYVRRDPDAAFREIEGEAVVIDTKHREMHSLNATAARVWALADGKITVRDIIKTICEEFEGGDETAEKDILSFITELEEKGVLTLSEEAAGD